MTRWQALGLVLLTPLATGAAVFVAGWSWAAAQAVRQRWGGWGLAAAGVLLLALAGVALLIGGW